MPGIPTPRARTITGKTREGYQEALFNGIEDGTFPKWTVQVQIMPEMDAEKTDYNPFDLTKVWPHAEYPPITIGEFELNRNADNYFTEIENAAFSPSNIVPGIAFSPDKMLQARIFAYADAHRHRLGTHYEQIPVNRPKNTVRHYHRDGQMNTYGGIISGNENAYYEPNSFSGAVEDRSAQEPPLRIDGNADRYDHTAYDDTTQVRALYRDVLDQGERDRLHANMGGALVGVPTEIVERWLRHLNDVHPDYQAGVRKEWEAASRDAGYDPNGIPVTGDTPQKTDGDAAQGNTAYVAAAE